MIARRYPPYNAVESTRPAMFAKYLPQFGWQPLVVCGLDTPEAAGERWDDELIPESRPFVVRRVAPDELKRPDRIVADTIARAGRLVRRGEARPVGSLLSDVRDGFLWVVDNLLPERSPYPFTRNLRRALPGLIARYRPDVIWATALPAGTHAAAAWAAARFGLPWVADHRDILEQANVRRARRTGLQRHWTKVRETRVARSAAAMATVSPALAEALQRRVRRPTEVIPNGYDPDQYPLTEPALDEKFTITYTGTVYIPQRDPRPLLAALDELIASGEIDAADLAVRFYGGDPSLVTALAAGYRCAERVEAHALVPRRQCHGIQQTSQVLLQLAHGFERGIMTGKLFEYLGARRPILSIPADHGGIDALLAETAAGRACSTGEEIRRALLAWYGQWASTGAARYEGRPEAVARYSRRRQAQRLAALLDRVVDGDR